MECETVPKYSILEKGLRHIDKMVYPLTPKKSVINPRKILLVRYDGIGDMISVLPAIEKLKRKFPKAKIDVVTREVTATLLKNNPYINKTIIFNNKWAIYENNNNIFSKISTFLKTIPHEFPNFLTIIIKGEYDLIIDFTKKRRNIIAGHLTRTPVWGFDIPGGSFLLNKRVKYNNKKHVIENNKRLIEEYQIKSATTRQPNIYLTKEELKKGKEFIKKHTKVKSKKVGIHVGYGNKPSKGWPIKRFNNVMNTLAKEKNITYFMFGAKQEKELLKNITTKHVDCTNTSLREMAAIIENIDLFVCNDSGPMHIAATTNTPIIALFGPTCEKQWSPYTKKAKIIRKISGGYCYKHNLNDNYCMKLITEEEVITNIKKSLKHEKNDIK
jgi:heptosyltransferase II